MLLLFHLQSIQGSHFISIPPENVWKSLVCYKKFLHFSWCRLRGANRWVTHSKPLILLFISTFQYSRAWKYQQVFNCWKLSTKRPEQCVKLFAVNNKDTGATSVTSCWCLLLTLKSCSLWKKHMSVERRKTNLCSKNNPSEVTYPPTFSAQSDP